MEKYRSIVRLRNRVLFETGTRNAFRYKGEGEPDRRDLMYNWGSEKWEPCRTVSKGDTLIICNRKGQLIDVYRMSNGKLEEPPELVPVESGKREW